MSVAWIAPVAAALVMALLKFLAPLKTAVGDREYTREELEREFKGWVWRETAVAVVALTGYFLAWYAFFFGLSVLQEKRLFAKNATMVFFAGPHACWIWLLPAGFLGFAYGAFQTGRTMRRWLGPRYPLYVLYDNMKNGYNARRVLVWLSMGMAVPALLLGFGILDFYVVATPNAMLINRMFSVVEEEHPYTQITDIKASDASRAPNGEVHQDWRFIVHFHDGSEWYSRWNPGMEKDEIAAMRKLAAYISTQSGVRITNVPILE